MGEYRKRRVTVGAVDVGNATTACLRELTAKLPAAPKLFVLLPDDDVAARFCKIVTAALPELVGKRLGLVNRNGPQCSLEAKHDPDCGRLTPNLVMHFETWMDQRSSGIMQEHLDAGHCIVLVQVSNSEEETDAYRIVGRYCAGGVQLHDLPA